MIQLRNITLRRGQYILLKNVNWTIYSHQRIGIVGANGSGKTTLFSLLLQQYSPDQGELEIAKNIKIASVEQESVASEQSAIDFVLNGDTELRELERALAKALKNNHPTRIANLHEKLAIIDAYSAPARAAQLLDGLGFTLDEQKKLVNEFSGGWRMRLHLAKALMCKSDVLLLDEPTNHLDLDAILWLEEWLIHYPGTLLLISHDRDFLDKTVDHIVHLEHQQLKFYSGNYSSFETLRASELLLQQAVYEKQQNKIAHMRSFVDRFRYKASKAKQAQSRLKAIERMELVCTVQAETPFQFEFKEPKKCPNPLIQLNQASIRYQDKVILNQINFSIAPRDRLAMIGPNGAGKSSLIKLLAGEISSETGERLTGPGLAIGYFAQHQIDQLQLLDSPLQHLRDLAINTSELELRQFLGGFGFNGERVKEAVKNFSGGEKSRLALALLVWKKPNLLLLDEPTNHLDLNMRNALSIALQEYTGALILVSHDRFLLRSTTDQLLLVADGQLQSFDGDLDDYQKWLFQYRKKTLHEKKISTNNMKGYQQEKVGRNSARTLTSKIKKLEEELSILQSKATTIENLLSDQSLYAPKNKEKLDVNLRQLTQLKQEIISLEEEWVKACEMNSKTED